MQIYFVLHKWEKLTSQKQLLAGQPHKGRSAHGAAREENVKGYRTEHKAAWDFSYSPGPEKAQIRPLINFIQIAIISSSHSIPGYLPFLISRFMASSHEGL
jgi:hypothetical protein